VTEVLVTAGKARVSAATTAYAVSREAYRTDFDRLAAGPMRGEPDWLKQFRIAAMQRFESLGFPTMRDEDWHFTSVAPIADRVFHPAEGGRVAPETAENLVFAKTDGPMVVFVNGCFAGELSSCDRSRGAAGGGRCRGGA